ncbi:MAG: DUF1887 family CARF protein [Bacteroidota bacterium]|nr:DUF1887 family CARF protein [Bacteroidota bacterium]
MTILVSIISEQSLPNYLFIKEFQQQADIFLFITTKDMENNGKSAALYETASIDNSNRRKITVDENELYLIQQKLDKLGWKNNPDKKFIVNITGGTKLMSNAVYNYFKKLNSRFFYVPFGQNAYQELLPEQAVQRKRFTYAISLHEYLSIYGISYAETEDVIPQAVCEHVFKSYQAAGFDKSRFPYPALRRLGYKAINNSIGTWFENMMYHRIRESLHLSEHQIGLNLELFDAKENDSIFQHDNEIDIAFVRNNRIHIIEAKSSIGKNKLNISNLYYHFYKLAAINKRFGLASRAFVVSLTDIYTENQKRLENIKQRCRILNLQAPMDRSDIDNKHIFTQKINQITK